MVLEMEALRENPSTETGHFYYYSHYKWLPYQITGGKTVNNVQIDPQITGEMVDKAKHDVVSESVTSI